MGSRARGGDGLRLSPAFFSKRLEILGAFSERRFHPNFRPAPSRARNRRLGGTGVENQDEISALFCRCWCSVSYGWDQDWNSGTQRVFVCRIMAGLSLVLREIVTEEVLNGSVEFGCQVH